MRTTRLLATLVLALTLTPSLARSPESSAPAPIRTIDAPATPVPVPTWDPASPQQLVRVAGTLYQQDSGFLYPVLPDRITVGLADGVADWADLVERAVAAAPGTFAVLAALTPERQNRLGIVDLLLPGGSPLDWSALVHQTGLVRFAEVVTRGSYTVTPNDPLYPQQWALHNTGQTGGTPGADVDAELAWEISAGNPAIVVGVLDSGTAVGHQDLAGNVWHNPGETPGNGIDDDGNGFIDDWEGWDFGNNNNNVNSSNFHGTHVTGIVNAVGGNGLGVVGLAGGIGAPGVRAMAVAVGESGPVSGILDDSIIYAVDNGAHVITMSLSVGSSTAINNALGYAYLQNDVFIDCAAGNNGASVAYPANRPEVMAVASTTHDDERSSFSNPGPELEVAAPGSNILSTQLNNTYGSSSGTSFAAPYVAALAALIRGVNPGLPAADVRQLIIDTADDVEAPGFDTETGWGRINAHTALSQAGSSAGTVALDAATYACDASLSIALSDFDLAGAGTVPVTVKSDREPAGEEVWLVQDGFDDFAGSLPLEDAPPAADGVLQVAHGDTVTVEYLDADNGEGGTDVLVTDTALVDCAGPAITAVTALNIDDAFATIAWTTDEPGSTVVRYGVSEPPGEQAASGTLVTGHAIVLADLEPCTAYKYEVESADALGNVAIDDNGGDYYVFQTLGNVPGVGVVPCQAGQALFDRTRYGCGSTVEVSVVDVDLDLDPEAIDTAQVLMTSTSEPDGEWIVLQESGAHTGLLEGTIQLGSQTAAADGQLTVAAGDLITASYFDADDGQGSAQVATAVASADCLPPQIQDLLVTEISSTRAVIQWTTEEPATSRVEFGSGPALGAVVEDLELETAHALAISAFDACDRAFFRVSSTDEFGETRIADDGGQPFELNLSEIGGLVFHDNFETPLGWSLAGEWERGVPQGLGSASGDPALAYSGATVLGTDLGGQGAFPGDYETGTASWAYSPTFSAVGHTGLELILRRKLGNAAGDLARIAAVKFLAQIVWSSSGATDDAGWQEQRIPVGQLDGGAAVQVGFGIESTTGHRYGWNIDEVIVKESAQPDYVTCNGCAGAPSFAGLAAVLDPAPCAASGLTLEWQPAPAWGTASGGTYEVYRGPTADFVPGDANRIAAGLTDTTWTDLAAPADVPVWYVVRARNNDAECPDGVGLDDGNVVHLSAVETIDQPPAGPVGATLAALPVGAAHVRLTWSAVPGADHYVVRRSTEADFGAAEIIGTTEGTLFEDVNAATEPGLYTYRVFAANACGVEETP
jgi:subtilisin family serine protease